MNVTRRETLRGAAILAVTEKFGDGGFAEVTRPGKPERGTAVLPPGAGDARRFREKCVACGLCMAKCPEKIIKPSADWRSFGQPELDFRDGRCLLGCVRCTLACPAEALSPLSAGQKPNVHLGLAIWNKERCLRCTEEEACSACVRKCPVQAIKLIGKIPVVNETKCIGCGACEHVCPARPLPAIYVKGYMEQKVITPMSEADLLSEMWKLMETEATLVLARDGVILARKSGRGIGPLLAAYDEGLLKDSIVVDKVIGKAAAAICALGGAKRVQTKLGAKGAATLLKEHSVTFNAKELVGEILNHAKTGSCPMEAAVRDLDDLQAMLSAIRRRYTELTNR